MRQLGYRLEHYSGDSLRKVTVGSIDEERPQRPMAVSTVRLVNLKELSLQIGRSHVQTYQFLKQMLDVLGITPSLTKLTVELSGHSELYARALHDLFDCRRMQHTYDRLEVLQFKTLRTGKFARFRIQPRLFYLAHTHTHPCVQKKKENRQKAPCARDIILFILDGMPKLNQCSIDCQGITFDNAPDTISLSDSSTRHVRCEMTIRGRKDADTFWVLNILRDQGRAHIVSSFPAVR